MLISGIKWEQLVVRFVKKEMFNIQNSLFKRVCFHLCRIACIPMFGMVFLLSPYLCPAVPVNAQSQSNLVLLYTYEEISGEWAITDQIYFNSQMEVRGYNFMIRQVFDLYFSNQEAGEGDKIDVQATAYHRIGYVVVDNSGRFSISFTLQELDDGECEQKFENGTYYIYVIYPDSNQVLSMATLNLVSRLIVLYHLEEDTDTWTRTDRGQIGENIEIRGYGFEADRQFDIYLSSNMADEGDEIDDKVTTYKRIGRTVSDSNNEFSIVFTVPAELNDGRYNKKIVYGNYYVYATRSDDKQIIGIATLTAFEAEIKVDLEWGHIGEWVAIDGDGFESNESVPIFFSSNLANIGNYLDRAVTAYEIVGLAFTGASGDFDNELPFLIPSELTQGDDEKEVQSGDYYFYATNYSGKRRIAAVSRFTVVTPEINLNPVSAVIGAEVTIIGSGFGRDKKIAIKYDNNDISTSSGDTATNDYGQFTSSIIIPPSSGLEHTIAVIDTSGYQSETKFIVAPQVSLKPASAVIGTPIEINGIDFRNNQKITIEYDDEHIGIVDGDRETDNNGRFTCTVIIPESTFGSHTITVADEAGNVSSVDYNVELEIKVALVSQVTQEQNMTYEMRVDGTGFRKNEDVTITLNDQVVSTWPQRLRTNDKGSFSSVSSLASVSSNGTIVVKAIGNKSSSAEVELSSSDITTSAGQASISLSPPTSFSSPGHVGMAVTVTGTGFIPNTTIALIYSTDGEIITWDEANTDDTGSFSIISNVPASAAGEHTVSATDGASNAASVFIMEAKAPPAPVPITSEFDTVVDSGAYFLWEAVNDPSEVVYMLQVSSNADFTDVVLEKKGLPRAVCTLPKEEIKEEMLESTEKTPYYWRIKAIDGAGNGSEWSPAMSFYVSSSGSSIAHILKFILYGLGIIIFVTLVFWGIRRISR